MRQIDLSGPDGNAFALIGIARNWAKQLGKDATAITAEMMTGDYNQLLDVFEREFGSIAEFINKPGDLDDEFEDDWDESMEPETTECPDCEGRGCRYCDHTGEIYL